MQEKFSKLKIQRWRMLRNKQSRAIKKIESMLLLSFFLYVII
mgnify:CR=1 FL=1